MFAFYLFIDVNGCERSRIHDEWSFGFLPLISDLFVTFFSPLFADRCTPPPPLLPIAGLSSPLYGLFI